MFIPGTFPIPVDKLDASTPDIQHEFFEFYCPERDGNIPQADQEELTIIPM